MESIWSSSTELSERESLHGDVRIQTVIIGAGMAGILTAYLLKKNGLNAVIIEAKQIGSGQTEHTTAKKIYPAILRRCRRICIRRNRIG